MCYYNMFCIITRTNTFYCIYYMFLQMPRQRPSTYRPPPRSRPHDSSGGSGTGLDDREGSDGQGSRSRIPETPRAGESSRGSTSQPGHMMEDDHDDCPYLVFDPNHPNVTWDGLPVIFPVGPAK